MTRRIVGTTCAVVAVSAAVALADRVECEGGGAGCVGTPRDDVIIGTPDGEGIDAGRGDDVIRARGGDDNAIRGDGGKDKLKGGSGEDHLGGGKGRDILKGGPGFDVYFFQENRWGQEILEDQPIVDNDINTGHMVRFDFVEGNLSINMTSGPGNEVRVVGGASTLDWDNDLIDSVVDGAGDDSITGRAIGDNIQAFNGGQDVIQSGGGDDFIYMADDEPNDAVSCGAGNDTARVDAGDSVDADCEVVQVLV